MLGLEDVWYFYWKIYLIIHQTDQMYVKPQFSFDGVIQQLNFALLQSWKTNKRDRKNGQHLN